MDGYIHKKSLIEFAHNHINGQIDTNDITRFPCANVIPKREIEKIFEEIERLLADHHYYDPFGGAFTPTRFYDDSLGDAFAEFKNKYLEVE